MKTYRITEKDRELINVAKEVAIKSKIESKSISCDVGSALITNKWNIYKGINIENKSSAPTSICGETGAIASMITNGENKVKTIVALYYKNGKERIILPCGSCRHIISQFGNPYVIISKSKKVKLNDLYPLAVK